jgi:brefeldin A-inhibited guanine nucleotide-exchange protein
VVVLRCLREVCDDGQLLVDLFVNYDCDIGSSNLFERLINGLVKMAQVRANNSSAMGSETNYQ